MASAGALLDFAATLDNGHFPPMSTTSPSQNLTHLQRLEAEAIHIMREVVAECEKPVMLYSIGKDSSVMLHLATQGVSSRAPALPVPARRHHLEIPRNDPVSR